MAEEPNDGRLKIWHLAWAWAGDRTAAAADRIETEAFSKTAGQIEAKGFESGD